MTRAAFERQLSPHSSHMAAGAWCLIWTPSHSVLDHGMAVCTETSSPGGSASELASRVAPRRRGATVFAYAVTTAGDGSTCRRTNIAISRGGSRQSGAAASPRLSRSGLFSTRARGNFPVCKALKTHEMRKFSPRLSARSEKMELRPRGQARLCRILSGHGISRRGRENSPGCKALKTHETRKLSPSSLRTKRHADQIGSAASAHPTSLHRKRPRTAVRLRTHAARGGGMRRGGVWNTAEERRKSTKIWRNITWGFGGLQLLEIPQNRQSFVWKSLGENTLDLEKLGEMQGRSPLFSHISRGAAPVSNGSSASWRKGPSQASAELVLLGRRGRAPGRPPPRGAARRRCSVYAAFAPDFTNL